MDEQKFNQTRSFNLGVAELFDIPTALLFDELSFWIGRGGRDDGWIYKTYQELMERLPLSEYQIREGYKKLEEAGWIDKKIMKASGNPTVHYRVLKNLSSVTQKTSVSIEPEKTLDSINTATNNSNSLTPVLDSDESDSEIDFIPEPDQAQKRASKNEIDAIIGLFESAYGVRLRGKPKERQYAGHLVKRFGYSEARKLVMIVLSKQTDKFFVRVSAPSEMWNKLSRISNDLKHSEDRSKINGGAVYV